jgi:hypothetical protein
MVISTGFRAPSLHQITLIQLRLYSQMVSHLKLVCLVMILGGTIVRIPQWNKKKSTSASIGFTAKIPEAKL